MQVCGRYGAGVFKICLALYLASYTGNLSNLVFNFTVASINILKYGEENHILVTTYIKLLLSNSEVYTTSVHPCCFNFQFLFVSSGVISLIKFEHH